MISDIGSEHVQVIPKFGLEEPLDKRVAAWSYSQVCEMAKEYDLKPAAIFLNMVRGLERLSDATAIALDSDQPEAMIIPDTYHMFLAGTGPNALGRLRGDFIAIFQFADAGKDVEPILHKGSIRNACCRVTARSIQGLPDQSQENRLCWLCVFGTVQSGIS